MDRTVALAAPAPRTPAIVALSVWFLAGLAVAASGWLTLERRFAVPVMLVGLVAAQGIAHRRGGSFRALADSVDTRALVLFHAVRAPIGIAFLLLMAHGLDATFARIAGIGDIVCGTGALLIGVLAPRSRMLVRLWNVVGLADILAVVFTAQRILIFSDHPQTMQILLHFPGMLLPTFLVPIVIAIHLLVWARLASPAPAGSA